jgi:NADH-quinone oxidoreductase subunit E
MVDRVREMARRSADNGGGLIPLLQEIQAEFNYVPPDSLSVVAETLGIPLSQVYGVATFYHSFSLTPRGEHSILCCLGTACHVRGGSRIAEEIARALGVQPGETTDDGHFTFETANCLGACALGPVVVVDGEYHARMTARKASALLDGLLRAEVAK